MTTTDSLKAYLKAVANAHANGKADYSAGALDVANGALDFLDILEGAGADGKPKSIILSEVTEPAEEPRVVQVNDKYVYLLFVSDHGNVRTGGTVDVEGRHGGHWEAKVSKVWLTVAEYQKDTGADDAPTLMVLEVIDSGYRT